MVIERYYIRWRVRKGEEAAATLEGTGDRDRMLAHLEQQKLEVLEVRQIG